MSCDPTPKSDRATGIEGRPARSEYNPESATVASAGLFLMNDTPLTAFQSACT